jgi:hypothetical protein
MKSTCEVVRDYWIKKSIELYDFQEVADKANQKYQICLQNQKPKDPNSKNLVELKPYTTEEINQKLAAMIQERQRQDEEFKKRYLLNK